MAAAPREARLMAEHVELYPGLAPGIWLPAAEVAEHIVAVVRREGGRLGLHGRVMSDEHFEFRGGSTSPARNRHERREDRA